jgi:E3 ubiquitin-protein ligase RNF115/126
MEIVEYVMKKYYCLDCQRKSLINIRGVLRCPECGSANVELARARRPHRVTEDHQWDSYMSSFHSPRRPNVQPRDFFTTGISHFGGLFNRRQRSLFDMFFDNFPDFGFPTIHSFFDEPYPFFTTMVDIGDILNHMAQQHPSGHQPASQESVRQLEDVKISEEQTNEMCSVCQEKFKLGELAKVLPCKHLFHPDCIIPWFRVKDSCPLCRHPII